MAYYLLIALLLFLLSLNLIATFAVWLDKEGDRRQQVAQTAAIWLVPLFAALLCIAMRREPAKRPLGYRNTVHHEAPSALTSFGRNRTMDFPDLD